MLETQFSHLIAKIRSTHDYETIKLAHEHFLTTLQEQLFCLQPAVREGGRGRERGREREREGEGEGGREREMEGEREREVSHQFVCVCLLPLFVFRCHELYQRCLSCALSCSA